MRYRKHRESQTRWTPKRSPPRHIVIKLAKMNDKESLKSDKRKASARKFP